MVGLLRKTVEVAEEAGKLLLGIQKGVREIKKPRKDFLTDADLKSHSLITARLRDLTPQVPIYSEENEEELKIGKEAIWVVDPLDGTINFFHQDFLWGVSIALVENQRTKLGVVCLPALNQTVGVGDKDEIVVRGNISLGVRKENNLSEAQIWTDWGKKSKVVLSLLPRLAEISLYPQIRLCATVSLMAVASGKISAYIHPHPAPEDFAAGALIVERAGGKVTDLQGSSWNLFSESIVASNSTLHDKLLKGLQG